MTLPSQNTCVIILLILLIVLSSLALLYILYVQIVPANEERAPIYRGVKVKRPHEPEQKELPFLARWGLVPEELYRWRELSGADRLHYAIGAFLNAIIPIIITVYVVKWILGWFSSH
jgi:hypothetical protein